MAVRVDSFYDEVRQEFRQRLKDDPKKISAIMQEVFYRSDVTQICKLCKVEKVLSDFRIERGYLTKQCLDCRKEQLRIAQKKYYQRKKQGLVSSSNQ